MLKQHNSCKWKHTHALTHTHTTTHTCVGQNRSSIKNEFRFPCCCLATVTDFAVTIFTNTTFCFTIYWVMVSLNIILLRKLPLLVQSKVFDIMHLRFQCIHTQFYVHAAIYKKRQVNKKPACKYTSSYRVCFTIIGNHLKQLHQLR